MPSHKSGASVCLIKFIMNVRKLGALLLLVVGFAGDSCVADTVTNGDKFVECHNPSHPNVLMIVIDDLNDWVGYLGGHPQARTPCLDALAADPVEADANAAENDAEVAVEDPAT